MRGGERGKWFAAAKDEDFLDVAVSCARTSRSSLPLSCAPRGIGPKSRLRALSTPLLSGPEASCSACSPNPRYVGAKSRIGGLSQREAEPADGIGADRATRNLRSRRLDASGRQPAKMPNPLSLAPQQKGNRRQAEVFERRYSASARGSGCPTISSKNWPGSHWNSPCSFEVLFWMLVAAVPLTPLHVGLLQVVSFSSPPAKGRRRSMPRHRTAPGS